MFLSKINPKQGLVAFCNGSLVHIWTDKIRWLTNPGKVDVKNQRELSPTKSHASRTSLTHFQSFHVFLPA